MGIFHILEMSGMKQYIVHLSQLIFIICIPAGFQIWRQRPVWLFGRDQKSPKLTPPRWSRHTFDHHFLHLRHQLSSSLVFWNSTSTMVPPWVVIGQLIAAVKTTTLCFSVWWPFKWMHKTNDAFDLKFAPSCAAFDSDQIPLIPQLQNDQNFVFTHRSIISHRLLNLIPGWPPLVWMICQFNQISVCVPFWIYAALFSYFALTQFTQCHHHHHHHHVRPSSHEWVVDTVLVTIPWAGSQDPLSHCFFLEHLPSTGSTDMLMQM